MSDRYDVFKNPPDGREKKFIKGKIPGTVAEKVDYASMSFIELQNHTIAGPVLQRISLDYLRTVESDYFNRIFTGELDDKGVLILRQGISTLEGRIPYQGKPSAMVMYLRGKEGTQQVAAMTVAELQ